jgi:predicted thioredoxin/glutaredoxin
MNLVGILEDKILDSRITLSPDEIKMLKDMMKADPDSLDSIEISIDKILKDGKVDISDIPEMILIISTLFKSSRKSKNIDYINVVRFIVNTLLDSKRWTMTISKTDLTLLKKNVDTSLELLNSNVCVVVKQTSTKCWFPWFV